jgi:hypothetical protein
MAVKFTNGKVQGFSCTGKKPVFLYDSGAKGLGLRATPGAKVFIYQGRLNNKTLRFKIGDVSTWTLDEARQEATKIQAMVDQGIDPGKPSGKSWRRSTRERRKPGEEVSNRSGCLDSLY